MSSPFDVLVKAFSQLACVFRRVFHGDNHTQWGTTMRSILGLTILVSFSHVLTAQDADTVKNPSPIGTWKWTSPVNGQTIHSVLRLVKRGEKISGMYRDENINQKIEDVVFDKGRIRFQFEISRDKQSATVKFNAKVEPQRLVGKVAFMFRGESYELDWQAKRGLVAEDVVGRWVFEFEDPEGIRRRPVATIVEKDERLGGTIKSDIGTSDLGRVKISQDQFSMSHSLDYDGAVVTLHYTCQPRGDELTGKIKYELGDEQGEFDVSAKREVKKTAE